MEYFEEGDKCLAECGGQLKYEPDGECHCHMSSPCFACVNSYLKCDKCGLDARYYE